MTRILNQVGLIIAAYVLALGFGLAAADTKPPEAQPPADLVQKAEKGDAAAQRELGLFYRQQRSTDFEIIKRNSDISNEWLKKAAEQGDAEAQYKYGTGFCGWYNALNRAEECIDWLGKAAEQGLAGAQRYLGIIYLYGGREINSPHEEFVKKDIDKAVNFLKKASAQNDPEAMYHLGYAYSQFKHDPKSAVEWYQKAAEMMHTRAMVLLADMHLRGTPHVQKNTPKALKLYHEAADLFDNDAKFDLAHLYMDGEFMPKDYKKAAALFREIDENTELIDHNNNRQLTELVVDAKLHLGLMHRDGLGTEKDEKEGVHYFRQAERFDSQAAQYLIGHAYEHGRGVARDFVAAYIWYKRAKDIAFRPFTLEVIDDKGMENHPMPGLDADKALEALAAKMNAQDLKRAKRYAAAEEHTRRQIESLQP